MASFFGSDLRDWLDFRGAYVWRGTGWVLTTSFSHLLSRNDLIYGLGGDDILHGEGGDDRLFGGAGNDWLHGGIGDDWLFGETGDDVLTGGRGRDMLDGGRGADVFVYEAVADSQVGPNGAFDTRLGDVIRNFRTAAEAPAGQRDRIDLSAIAATAGRELSWSGRTASAHGVWQTASGRATLVNVDVNGDARADMVVWIDGLKTLRPEDFIGLGAQTTVTSVSFGANDGALSAGETVTIAVTFSAAVFLSGGVPQLLLSNGGTASYASGSGTNRLVFSYTPTAGQQSADLAIAALQANGARIADASGWAANLSGAAANPAGTLIVDTAAPLAPSVRLAVDSGTSATDRLTNSGTLIVSGLEAGASVQYSTNGGLTWASSFTAVEGANALLLRQVDVAGNASAATSFSFTLDRAAAAPAVALAHDTGSSAGDRLTHDATLALTGVEAGAVVEYSADGGSTWTRGFTPAEGANSLRLRQVDAAGNVSAATDFTFTLDTTPPAAPGVALQSDSQGPGGSATDGITSVGALAVSGTEAGASLEYALTNGASWSSSFVAAEGANSLLVRQVDAAGNPSLATAFSFTLDTTPPAPVITGYSNGSSLLITGTSEPLSTVVLHGAASGPLTTVAAADGSWSLQAGALSYGRHAFTAVATDIVGLTGNTPAPFGIEILPDLSSLAPSQGFIVQGDGAGDHAGASVAAAGDVNGDGFGDVIIGAPLGDDAGTDAGEAYVVFGTASGFGALDALGRSVIDLTGLSASQGFVIQGVAAGDLAGRSVSAGDVNGDGFDDLILRAGAGEACVIFGGASGFGTAVTAAGVTRQVVDLAQLTAQQGFLIRGGADGGVGGMSVAAAGDVNGDGFDDMVIGAPGGDAGEAYVLFGQASGFGTAVTEGGVTRQVVGLAALLPAQGFVIQGDLAGDGAGLSVAAAGDVNGDGLDDIAVSAPGGDDGGSDAGEAYVIFGSIAAPGTVDGTGRRVLDLASLAGTQGVILQGDIAGDSAGWSVALAGDVNGDGFDDIAVGAPLGDDGGTDAGEAYVIFGTSATMGSNVTVDGLTRRVIDFTSLSAAQGFVIQGDAAGDRAGWSVAAAGDVNGDGFDDIIVGSPAGDNGGIDAGEAHVIFGTNAGFGSLVSGRRVLDLTALTAAQGFAIRGENAGDGAGGSVAAAGDVNRDGYDDLIVGAPQGDDGGPDAGEAYVVFGGPMGRALTPVTGTGTNSAQTFIGGPGDDVFTGNGGADVFRGGAGNDVFGIWPVGTFADIDGGSGTDTLRFDGVGLNVNLDTMPPGDMSSVERIDLTGTGNNMVALDRQSVLDMTEERVNGVAAVTITGNAGDAVTVTDLGWVAQGTLLQNGVTFNRFTNGNAELRVQSAVGFTRTVDLTTLAPAQGFVIQGDAAGDQAGYAVSSAGDVNGDGLDDMLVTAMSGDDGGLDAGEAYVIFGAAGEFGAVNATGRRVIDLTTLTPAQGFVIQGDAVGDFLGRDGSGAGDVNGDGFDDVILGAWLAEEGGGDAGGVYVVFGAASGLGTADAAGRRVIDLSSLSSTQGFIIQADAANDRAGTSVSGAGDVNGDGLADMIIGAFAGDDGGTDAGEAYVVFGSASGFGTIDARGRSVLDLTSLSTGQGFVIQGQTDGDNNGFSVSAAGDVNGDGFDDIISGAHGNDQGSNGAGDTYVIFGTGSGSFGTPVGGFSRQVITVGSLTAAQGFVIRGDVSADLSGYAVSSAGDVNGDGFDDVIVAAPWGDDGGLDAGEAYVVFGGASGFGVPVSGRQVIDLTSLAPAQGFVIQADETRDFLGFLSGVSSAGDVNGDGFDDLIVGARYGDNGGGNAGEAYVIFGSAAAPGTVDATGRNVLDLTHLLPERGFIVQGDAAGDWAGWSVSAAGDVNGDGYDDLMVGAPSGDDGGSNAGEAYVLFGSPFGMRTAATGTAAADILIGTSAPDTLTGNGGADVLRGGQGDDTFILPDTRFADIDGGTGTDTLRLTGAGLALDLTLLPPGEITSIERIDITGAGASTLRLDKLSLMDLSEERSGGAVGLTVSGDSDDTVDIADFGWSLQGTVTEGGISYNRYVRDAAELRVTAGVTVNYSRAVQDLTILSPAKGFIIQGDAAGDQAGYSVSSAGDINGDGFDDLIVGAPTGDDGGADAGEAYVIFGRASGFGAPDAFGRRFIDLTSLSAADGFIIQGDAAGDNAGWSVSSAGDMNGDGFGDLVIGARTGDDGGSNAGEAYVVFGSATGFGSSVTASSFARQVVDLTSLSASEGFVIRGDNASDQTGVSAASAGDVNGDGYADLLIGAHMADGGGTDGGSAYLVYGGATGFGTPVTTGGFTRQVMDLSFLGASQGFMVFGDAAFDYAGWSVALAGDINGDGFGDIIIGARGGDDGGADAGEAYVIYGGASGFGTPTGSASRQTIDLTSLSPAQGFLVQGDLPGDAAGWSVASAGDVNGDGLADMVIGARDADGGGTDAGEAYVIFGSATAIGTVDATGRRVLDLTAITPAQGFLIRGDEPGDGLGISVAGAGDVNGDGFCDLIAGASLADGDGANAGEAYVIFGAATAPGTADAAGRRVVDLNGLTEAQGFSIRGDMPGDQAGSSVAAAGDVNGDGFDDLIVGAPQGDAGGANAGAGYVIFGRAIGAAPPSVATAGADTFSGLGAGDVLRAGAGNDVIGVSATSFAKVDGGAGADTLWLDGAGMTLDLDARLEGIEIFDITGSGANAMSIAAARVLAGTYDSIFDFTGSSAPRELFLRGNAGDTVTLQGIDADGAGPGAASHVWQLVQADVDLAGAAGGPYDYWALMAGDHQAAMLAIDADIEVGVVP